MPRLHASNKKDRKTWRVGLQKAACWNKPCTPREPRRSTWTCHREWGGRLALKPLGGGAWWAGGGGETSSRTLAVKGEQCDLDYLSFSFVMGLNPRDEARSEMRLIQCGVLLWLLAACKSIVLYLSLFLFYSNDAILESTILYRDSISSAPNKALNGHGSIGSPWVDEDILEHSPVEQECLVEVAHLFIGIKAYSTSL